MFLHDSERSAATTDANLSLANAPALKLLWNFTAGGPIATSISIVGTTAYVGAWDGYEYAVNTSNGALLWKTYLGITNDPNCAPATLNSHPRDWYAPRDGVAPTSGRRLPSASRPCKAARGAWRVAAPTSGDRRLVPLRLANAHR
jgi:hypothetical protein